ALFVGLPEAACEPGRVAAVGQQLVGIAWCRSLVESIPVRIEEDDAFSQKLREPERRGEQRWIGKDDAEGELAGGDSQVGDRRRAARGLDPKAGRLAESSVNDRLPVPMRQGTFRSSRHCLQRHTGFRETASLREEKQVLLGDLDLVVEDLKSEFVPQVGGR